MTILSTANALSASTVAVSAAPNKGAAETQPNNTFGAVLARQIGDGAPKSADAPQPALEDKKGLTDKGTTSSKAQDDKQPAAPNLPADPTSNLIALLQPFQEVRTPSVVELAGESSPSKGDPAKIIARSLSTKMTDTRAAKDVASNGLAKTDATAPSINPIDSKNLPANIVKFAEPTDSLATSIRATAPLAENVAAFTAPSLLHSALPTAPGISATTQQSITTPFGGSGWTDEFSQKISWMSNSKQDQIAELHLNPPDLGPLNVVLKISDNQATALFTSPHSAVREAVESAMPKLRELLADNGITLGNTTVSDQPRRDGNASAFTGQQPQHQGGPWVAQNSDQADNSARPTVPRNTVQRHNGMVDTFA